MWQKIMDEKADYIMSPYPKDFDRYSGRNEGDEIMEEKVNWVFKQFNDKMSFDIMSTYLTLQHD